MEPYDLGLPRFQMHIKLVSIKRLKGLRAEDIFDLNIVDKK